jgi:hypothetical protein
MNARIPCGLLFLAALPTACSSAYSVDNVCLTSVKAECHFEFACCTETERNFVANNGFGFGQASDESSCIDLGAKFQCSRFSVVSDSVKAGRFAYDDNQAAACWDPVVEAADKCDAAGFFNAQSRLNAPVCDPFAGKGLVDQGAFCFVNEECKDAGECVIAHSPTVVTAEGRCGAPPPATGSPCPADGFCGTGSICNGFINAGEGEGEGGGPPPPAPTPSCQPFAKDGEPSPNGAQFCESGTCGGNPPVCGKASTGGETFDICHGGAQ